MLQLEQKSTQSINGELGTGTSKVDLEMQPSTLSTLLEGLGRIRDQLSTVANKR